MECKVERQEIADIWNKLTQNKIMQNFMHVHTAQLMRPIGEISLDKSATKLMNMQT